MLLNRLHILKFLWLIQHLILLRINLNFASHNFTHKNYQNTQSHVSKDQRRMPLIQCAPKCALATSSPPWQCAHDRLSRYLAWPSQKPLQKTKSCLVIRAWHDQTITPIRVQICQSIWPNPSIPGTAFPWWVMPWAKQLPNRATETQKIERNKNYTSDTCIFFVHRGDFEFGNIQKRENVCGIEVIKAGAHLAIRLVPCANNIAWD